MGTENSDRRKIVTIGESALKSVDCRATYHSLLAGTLVNRLMIGKIINSLENSIVDTKKKRRKKILLTRAELSIQSFQFFKD